MYRQLLFIMEKNISSLRKRVIPILNYCQAKKGDLDTYESWENHNDAGKKLFYAYYSGLFCRIFYVLEDNLVVTEDFTNECNRLIDKYNWYDIREEDLKLCASADPYGCEAPDALMFLDGIDNVAWGKSSYNIGRDAVCLKTKRGTWTFADVRGSIRSSMRDREQ